MPHPKSTTLPVTLALSFLIGTTAFAVDGSLPALPSVAAEFASDVSATQGAVGIYILGYACGQIPVGLLADRLGRMPVLIVGMALFLLAALMVAASTSVEMLLTLRFFQGAFGATGVVLARAIARDVTEGTETVRIMGFLSVFLGLAMVMAPMIGAILVQFAGWRVTFGASALFGAIGLFLSIIFIRETRPDTAPPTVRHALTTGVIAFANNAQSVFGTALMALTFATLMVFVTLTSDIFINDLGFSEIGYALVFGVSSLGYVSGAFALRWLAKIWESDRLILGAAGAMALASVVLAICGLRTSAPVGFVIAALFVLLLGISAMMALASAAAIQDLAQTAGMGAGIMGTLQLSFGGLVSFAATYVAITTLERFALSLALLGGIVAVCATLYATLIIRRRMV